MKKYLIKQINLYPDNFPVLWGEWLSSNWRSINEGEIYLIHLFYRYNTEGALKGNQANQHAQLYLWVVKELKLIWDERKRGVRS